MINMEVMQRKSCGESAELQITSVRSSVWKIGPAEISSGNAVLKRVIYQSFCQAQWLFITAVIPVQSCTFQPHRNFLSHIIHPLIWQQRAGRIDECAVEIILRVI